MPGGRLDSYVTANNALFGTRYVATNGKIRCFEFTDDYLYNYHSDDNGKSWQAQWIMDAKPKMYTTSSETSHHSKFITANINPTASGSTIFGFTTIFENYRNPILCWYTDQSANISFGIIVYNGNGVTINNIRGTTNVSISGTDLNFDGYGNWGAGIAIGFGA